MTITRQRPPVLDDLGDLMDRASDAAGSMAGQAEEAVASLGEQVDELGADVGAEARRGSQRAEIRSGAAIVTALALAFLMSWLIVLARGRAAAVRRRTEG